MRVTITAIIFCFSSCSENSDVTKKLSGCDSLVINFFEPQSDIISKSVATADEKAINRVSEFVSAKETEAYKCGYSGSLHFYERGKMVSDVSFNYSEGCRHFLLDVKGKLTSTMMSNEAADFLKGLAEGKDSYW